MTIWNELPPLLDEYSQVMEYNEREPEPPKAKPLNNQNELDKYNQAIDEYNQAHAAWLADREANDKRERELYWQIKAIVTASSTQVKTRTGGPIYPVFSLPPYTVYLLNYQDEEGSTHLIIKKGDHEYRS